MTSSVGHTQTHHIFVIILLAINVINYFATCKSLLTTVIDVIESISYRVSDIQYVEHLRIVSCQVKSMRHSTNMITYSTCKMNRTAPSRCRLHRMCIMITMPTDFGQNKSNHFYEHNAKVFVIEKCSECLNRVQNNRMNLRTYTFFVPHHSLKLSH